jgi:hypothetical protein
MKQDRDWDEVIITHLVAYPAGTVLFLCMIPELILALEVKLALCAVLVI